jgi:hypothetical protein
MHTMKNRITLTMDPEVAKRAKRIAHERKTSVSALIEDLVRSTPVLRQKSRVSFTDKWAGKLQVRESSPSDLRLKALKERYRLGD